MAAPFFLFQPATARWVSVAAGVACVFWSCGVVQYLWSAIRRPKRERTEKQIPWRVQFFILSFRFCAEIMIGVVIVVLALGWTYWAYDLDLTKGKRPELAMLLLLFILVPALFLALAPAFARENGGPASQLLKGIRDQGLGRFHLFYFSDVALLLGTVCLIPIIEFSDFHQLVTIINNNAVVPIWDLAIAFPVIPATFLAAAILLSAPRLSPSFLVKYSELPQAYMGGEPVLPGLDNRAKKILGLTVVSGMAATLFVVLYPFHVALVAAESWVKGLTPLMETMEAVDSTLATQREAGRSTAEIAAELNRIGSWNADAPDAGLATLVEEPGRVFVDTCSVRTAAGVTNPSDHGAFDWLPAEQAASDLKYCIAISCASPVRWDAPPALILVSSHDSQATHWIERVFLDVFADGAAVSPGGYCTADGGLAERFQG